MNYRLSFPIKYVYSIGIVFVFFVFIFSQIPSVAAQSSSPQEVWLSTTPLPIPLADRNAAFHSELNSIYVIAGQDQEGNPRKEVYYAQIGPGVLLSGWNPTYDLCTPEGPCRPRHSHAVVATDKFAYTIGGWNGTIVSDGIYRAEFMSDSSLTNWNRPNRVNHPTQEPSAVIFNGYIYIVGGASQGGSPQDHVYYNKILEDGRLDVQENKIPLPSPLFGHALVAYNDYLYVIGGYDKDGQPSANISRAPIEQNKSVGNWEPIATLPTSPINLNPKPRYYSGAIVRNGQLIILGGRDKSTVFSDVISAPINSDGKLGDWTFGPPLPEPARYRFGVAMGKLGQIYVTGGLSIDHDSKNREIRTYHKEVYVLSAPPSIDCQMSNSPARQLAPGSQINYTINCQVGAAFDADNITLTNIVPGGLFTVSAPSGVFDPSVNKITWQFEHLDPGETISVSYSANYPSTSDPNNIVINSGANVSWQSMPGDYTSQSNSVVNSTYSYFLSSILR